MTTPVMTQNTVPAEAGTRSAGRRAAAPAAGNGMNGSLPTEANHIIHARVLARAATRLQAKYATLDGHLVRHTLSAAYRDLSRSARLKTHLPVIAINQAENRLRDLAARAAVNGADHIEETERVAPAVAA